MVVVGCCATPPVIYVICKASLVEIALIRVRSRAMSILRRVLDKAVRLTALAGIGYLLVTIVITFVTRFQNSLWTTLISKL